jgi:hypothetical protein
MQLFPQTFPLEHFRQHCIERVLVGVRLDVLASDGEPIVRLHAKRVIVRAQSNFIGPTGDFNSSILSKHSLLT